MVVGDLARAIVLASIPLAWGLDVLSMSQLIVVGFVTGVGTVFFDVAYQSYLPHLVGREHLVEGNSKLEVVRATTQIGGPAMAGGLIQVLTAPIAIVVDAVSFVLSAVFLGRIRNEEPKPVRRARRAPWPRDLGGSAVRPRQPPAALDRRLHRDVQPVLDRGHGDADRLPRPRPQPVAGADRPVLLARLDRRNRRGVPRQAGRTVARPGAGDLDLLRGDHPVRAGVATRPARLDTLGGRGLLHDGAASASSSTT